jgi:hypothetical protein
MQRTPKEVAAGAVLYRCKGGISATPRLVADSVGCISDQLRSFCKAGAIRSLQPDLNEPD